MATTYKESEMRIFKAAVQLEQIVKEQNFPMSEKLLSDILAVEQRLQNKKFRVAVVGEFNRGKSSMINVLLGQRILPEDVLASTATINRVTYGKTPKAYLIMKNSQCTEEIPVEDLASYVTKLTEKSAKIAEEIQEAVVEYPTMLCLNEVDLIDTPGMNDAEDMNAVTVNRLEDIDLAIVALNAAMPYSETENAFVLELLRSSSICRIIFVVTHIDGVREREREKLYNYLSVRIREKLEKSLKKIYQPNDLIFTKYHTIFDHLRLYGVSSVDGMDALETNDMELYRQSGFLTLTNELPEIILSGRSIDLLENAKLTLTKIIDACTTELEKQKNSWKENEKLLVKLTAFDSDMLTDKLAEYVFTLSSDPSDVLEQEKKNSVKRLISPLVLVKDPSAESIQKAMVPIMKSEFQRVNALFRQKKRAVAEAVYQRMWKPLLDNLEKEVPKGMRTVVSAEWDKEAQEAFERYLGMQEDFYNIVLEKTEDNQNEFLFHWKKSPIRAVVETEYGQSVFPALKDAADAAYGQGEANLEQSIIDIFSDLGKELKLRADTLSAFLQKWIQKKKSEQDNGTVFAELRKIQDLYEN